MKAILLDFRWWARNAAAGFLGAIAGVVIAAVCRLLGWEEFSDAVFVAALTLAALSFVDLVMTVVMLHLKNRREETNR